MKLNSTEFKEYVLNEIKKLAENQGWTNDLDLISENTIHSLNENEFELVDPEEWETQKSSNVEEVDIQKVNQLNEELKRMRVLVDFRNPFFEQK